MVTFITNSDTLNRFMSKVEKTDKCWLWTACQQGNGYGYFRVGAKLQLAHRVSYEIANGPIPKEFYICHTCDNKLCVNPYHLFLGTPQDNVDDKIAKGRHRTGSKLNQYIANLIRKSPMRAVELAAFYKVSKATIWLIRQDKIWRHI